MNHDEQRLLRALDDRLNCLSMFLHLQEHEYALRIAREVAEELRTLAGPHSVAPTWSAWIADKRAHTCTCGHVSWAHWANGRCAHCACVSNNAEPEPTRSDR